MVREIRYYYFGTEEKKHDDDLPSSELAEQAVKYARELEMIVSCGNNVTANYCTLYFHSELHCTVKLHFIPSVLIKCLQCQDKRPITMHCHEVILYQISSVHNQILSDAREPYLLICQVHWAYSFVSCRRCRRVCVSCLLLVYGFHSSIMWLCIIMAKI